MILFKKNHPGDDNFVAKSEIPFFGIQTPFFSSGVLSQSSWMVTFALLAMLVAPTGLTKPVRNVRTCPLEGSPHFEKTGWSGWWLSSPPRPEKYDESQLRDDDRNPIWMGKYKMGWWLFPNISGKMPKMATKPPTSIIKQNNNGKIASKSWASKSYHCSGVSFFEMFAMWGNLGKTKIDQHPNHS